MGGRVFIRSKCDPNLEKSPGGRPGGFQDIDLRGAEMAVRSGVVVPRATAPADGETPIHYREFFHMMPMVQNSTIFWFSSFFKLFTKLEKYKKLTSVRNIKLH